MSLNPEISLSLKIKPSILYVEFNLRTYEQSVNLSSLLMSFNLKTREGVLLASKHLLQGSISRMNGLFLLLDLADWILTVVRPGGPQGWLD
jgi:hypothetical protein